MQETSNQRYTTSCHATETRSPPLGRLVLGLLSAALLLAATGCNPQPANKSQESSATASTDGQTELVKIHVPNMRDRLKLD